MTETEPVVRDDWIPTPWSMLREVAPDTLQESVVELPAVMELGEAEKLVTVGGEGSEFGAKVKTIVSPGAIVTCAEVPEMLDWVKAAAVMRYIVPVPPVGLYCDRSTSSVSGPSAILITMSMFPYEDVRAAVTRCGP